jgi:hypothetical protein
MVIALASGSRAGAFTEQAPSEVQLKAAFLLNFAKFVAWANDDRPLGICIAGNPALTAATAEVVRGSAVGGRTVMAIALPASNVTDGCDVLYLADAKPDDALAILARVRGPVLTVGETPRFLRDGGVVRMFIDGNRLRFQVNRKQADAAGLKISSQLMMLASQ